MFLDQDVYSFNEYWLYRIRDIVGDDTEEKKALFSQFATDLEQIKITKQKLEKRIKKLKIVHKIVKYPFAICLLISIFLLKSDYDLSFLLALIGALGLYITSILSDLIYKLEHTDPMPSGYFSIGDVYAMNKYLSVALNNTEFVCNAKRKPLLGHTAYYADLENLHLDVSDCIRPGSPDEVPVTFAIGINLGIRNDGINLSNMHESLMVNVIYFCIPVNPSYRIKSIVKKIDDNNNNHQEKK